MLLTQLLTVAVDKLLLVPRWTIDTDWDRDLVVGAAELRARCTEVYRTELHLLFRLDLISTLLLQLLLLLSLQLILLMQLD